MDIKFKVREADPRKPGLEQYKETQKSPFRFGDNSYNFPRFPTPFIGEKK